MSFKNQARGWIAAIAVLLCAGLAQAVSINYGNFVAPPGVNFNQVTESSATDATPLYGPPTPFATGLDFNPTNFVSSSAGGSQDITDGQLNFTVVGNGLPINSLNFFEAGDYTLQGLGTATTSAFAGLIVRVTVTQINGADVAPISLTPANASVAFNLVANPGITQPWSMNVFSNISGQLGAGQNATRIDVVIDNQLGTISQEDSLAFIAKKDFRVTLNTIPEPASLAGILGLGVLVMRRRQAV